ncbi:tetratricopeptide repeat protein [Chryseobacterium daeguense]|uniref:tetratricopeptide repeat protein n=1 Tax=Chryseobacterium daeguense TaxID=412438 RepID=UPI0004882C66|nr:hypothetical protein [Chryseobacterium daeguense]
MFPNHLKNIGLLLFIFCSLQFKSQIYTVDQLDSINNRYWDSGRVADFVKFNLEMQKKYKKANNIEGIVNTSIGLGAAFTHLNKQKEALDYLDKANNNISKIKNPLLISRIYHQYGELYSLSDLYKEANKNFDKAILYAKKMENSKKRTKRLYLANMWKWYNFDKMGMIDSMYAIQYKNIKNFPNDPLVYEKIAGLYISKKKHLDSAEYYLNKALPLANNKSAIYNKGLIYGTYGDLFVAKGEGDKALPYYLKALDIFSLMKNKFVEKEIYNKISKAYKTTTLNDPEKAELYYKKYSYLNDSISQNEKQVLGAIVDKLVVEKEKEQQQKDLLYVIISVIVILSLVLFFFIRRAYIRKQQKKDIIIKAKAIEIKEKAKEADELKKKVNDSFEEVINLAKASDPFFLRRFKEVYPEFYEKLIAHQPGLTEHDIKYAAYIRLNLTNKEIALYDNLAIRSVESKKYRLKKKLELQAEEDLTKWILEL